MSCLQCLFRCNFLFTSRTKIISSQVFTLFKSISKLYVRLRIIKKTWYYNLGGRKSNTMKKKKKMIKKYAEGAYRHLVKLRVRRSTPSLFTLHRLLHQYRIPIRFVTDTLNYQLTFNMIRRRWCSRRDIKMQLATQHFIHFIALARMTKGDAASPFESEKLDRNSTGMP